MKRPLLLLLVGYLLTGLAVPTMGLSLLAAFLLGRAAVALAREKGQPLGARAWLVYPGILAVGLPLFAAVTLWPVVAAGAVHWHLIKPAEWYREHVAEVLPDNTVRLRHGDRSVDQYTLWRLGTLRQPNNKYLLPAADRASHEEVGRALDRVPGPVAARGVVLAVFLGVGMLLAWWLVLGVAFWAFPAWPPVLFFPLLTGYDYLHGVRLAACSGLGLVVWAGFAQRVGVATWV